MASLVWFPDHEHLVLGMRMRLCLFTFGTWHVEINITEMTLYRYFKASDTTLPDPQGRQSKELPSTAIVDANSEGNHLVLNY